MLNRTGRRAARRTFYDGRWFHSYAESKRYQELKLDPDVKDLQTQTPFSLVVNGKLICRYLADFTYEYNGEKVIEDCKGHIEPLFKLKWKLCQALFPAYKYVLSKVK